MFTFAKQSFADVRFLRWLSNWPLAESLLTTTATLPSICQQLKKKLHKYFDSIFLNHRNKFLNQTLPEHDKLDLFLY